jgi:NADH dehydrogenase FAD-containing subunit
MATVGGTSAILELGSSGRPRLSMAGFVSWVAWRSAYLTRLGSLRNRFGGGGGRTKLGVVGTAARGARACGQAH